MPNFDYKLASDEERLRSIYPGDPVGDYYRYTEVQLAILEDERIVGQIGQTGLMAAAQEEASFGNQVVSLQSEPIRWRHLVGKPRFHEELYKLVVTRLQPTYDELSDQYDRATDSLGLFCGNMHLMLRNSELATTDKGQTLLDDLDKKRVEYLKTRHLAGLKG